MRWEQRKPLWPVMAALGLLFVLALVAPRTWQGTNSQREKALDVIAPPLASSQVTVRLPVTEITGSREPAVASEPLPIRREFDLDTLLYVRDLLQTVLNQRPKQPLLTSSSPSEPQPKSLERRPVEAFASGLQLRAPQVRVSSPNDRLAMLPRFERASNTLPPSVETTDQQIADFAEILLEAARHPIPTRPVLPTPPPPRVAMLLPQPVSSPAVVQQEAPVIVEEVQTEAKEESADAMNALVEELPPVEPLLRHRPTAFIEELEKLSAGSAGAAWSQQVLAQLRLWIDANTSEQPPVDETLAELQRLFQVGMKQAENLPQPVFHNQWQQAAQALGRRLQIWQLLLDPEQPKIIQAAPIANTLLTVVDEVATCLAEEQNGNDWHQYLLLDRIAAATSEGMELAPLKRTKLAQEVLSRMADPQLTAAQRDFLATPLLVQLHETLRPWASGKVNLETLAALIERYEAGREMRFAGALAQLGQRLKWSDDPRLQALATHLDTHYRGANMRLAMSDHLLNRMVPEQKPIVTPVRDQIAGTKVRGRARTTTKVRIRLMPDPVAWRFGLEASGKVYSDTKSDTWPARVRNAAKMHYQGRKEISIDGQGLHALPAQAQARGRNELIGVDSQLDPIPLVGHLLRDIARQKHKKARPLALNQAKAKVVRQVKQRLDTATDQKLADFEQKFREKVLAPIEQLALLAEPLDMYTTDQRAVMQLRLANTDQLAAHTLRPLAPSDSVISLQVHETALNNAMMGLGLQSRRMTMIELFDYLAEQFGQSDASPPEEMPRKAVIEFAARDTVRIECQGDRVELILSVAELAYRRDKIKNFRIHVHFRPVLSGLDVRLVRSGTLQFSGRRLKTGPRVVLHSIIGKLIEKDQEIHLINEKLLADGRLAGLMVTQLVIEDGWVGLALGPAHPRRTAWRVPVPEVLSTPFVR